MGECLHVSFFFPVTFGCLFSLMKTDGSSCPLHFPHNESQQNKLCHTCEDLSGVQFQKWCPEFTLVWMQVNVPHFCSHHTSAGSEVSKDHMGQRSDPCGSGESGLKDEIGLLKLVGVQIMMRFSTHKWMLMLSKLQLQVHGQTTAAAHPKRCTSCGIRNQQKSLKRDKPFCHRRWWV